MTDWELEQRVWPDGPIRHTPVAALQHAAEEMAQCIEFFWVTTPCEHGHATCRACEVERWALLQDALEQYRLLVPAVTEDA